MGQPKGLGNADSSAYTSGPVYTHRASEAAATYATQGTCQRLACTSNCINVVLSKYAGFDSMVKMLAFLCC